jgi:23S rRNA 5-hydroxycytidine C2501 synthase
METKKLELLSPAKDSEHGIAAINCGADAVYIGAPKYGARAAAGNSLKEIDTLVKYAHKYWAKVYVTLNTLLFDNELDEARSLIYSLYNAGADAIIIQDMGILEMDLPPIPLFASTQTHNYDLKKIQFLESAGLQRIILARELSLEQIKEIKDNTKVDLEFFVHGALCVCFSGQCYLSFAKNGRSANRGECSQPCRMLYSLEDSAGRIIENDKYLLSLKDLNLSAHLSELIDAGISSFKIEGRLKDINYVKNVTAFYRQKLDAIIENTPSYKKSSSGKIFYSFTPDLERTFNRGYTEYFINGGRNKPASLDTQKSIGKFLGLVKNVGADFFEIDASEEISNGDGVCFFSEDNILFGMNVNRVNGNVIFTKELDGIYKGAAIYRNSDRRFLKELSKDETYRKIKVNFELFNKDGALFLKAIDENGNKAEYKFDPDLALADNTDKATAVITNQLKKTGDSVFTTEDIKINLSELYFLPISKINKARRAVIEELGKERFLNYKQDQAEIKPNSIPYPEEQVFYSGNAVNSLAKKFYQRHSAEIIEDGFELLKDAKGKTILTSKYCIKAQLNLCPFSDNKSDIEKLKEPLYINDGQRKYKLEFNCSQCQMSIIL